MNVVKSDPLVATQRRAFRASLAHVTDGLLVATIVALPLYPWISTNWQMWGQPVRLLLAAALAAAIVTEAARCGRIVSALALSLALVACLQLLATIRAPDLEYGLRELVNSTLYVPVALLVWSPRRLALVAWGGLATGAVLALGAVLQVGDLLGGTWGIASEDGESLTRLTSFLQNPNDFGLAMALCATTTTALLTTSRGPRALLLAMLGVFIGGVVASASRGSLVALLVGCIALAVILAVDRGSTVASRRLIAAPALLVALVGGVAMIGSEARDFRHSIVGSTIHGDPSTQARLDRWSILLGGPINPVFGSGFGGFAQALDRDSPQLLLNPGAEEGLVGWTALSPRAVRRLVNSPVYAGDTAVLMSAPKGSSLRLSIGGGRTSAIPNQRYLLSIAVRPSAPANVRLSVRWQERGSGGTVETPRAARALVSSQWQVLSDEFSAPGSAEFAIPVVTVTTTGEPLRVYLDSANVRRLDPLFADPEPPIWALRRELTVDNGFLRLFLEQGVIGVLALLATFIVAAVSSPSIPTAPKVILALPCIILAMVSVRALTADLFTLPLWSFLVWLSIGLVAALTSIRDRSNWSR